MDFLDLAKSRFSVRSFKEDAIPADVLDKILEAGRVAPTACNKQPQRIYAVTSGEGIAKMRTCTRCHFGAPAVLIVGYDCDECWKRPFDGKASGDIDASIVATHMMMEAASLGIGSTWVMFFDPAVLRDAFDLPVTFVPTALLPMGYPAEGCTPAPMHGDKKAMEETVTRV